MAGGEAYVENGNGVRLANVTITDILEHVLDENRAL